MARKPSPNPPGRPEYKVTDEILRKVEQYAGMGANMDQIAYAIGWNPDTLYRKKRMYSELSEALKRGKARTNIQVGGKLYKKAMGGNVTAMIYWLKTQGGEQWREDQRNMVDEGIPVPIVYKVDPPVDRIKVTRGQAKDEE